ncbi:MAG TPA: divalent-cation tolerance protein CutA [Opitutaceae bacterium]|nr:divalent-cation tolerance protein CutA [Opitutaceae bacterium]
MLLAWTTVANPDDAARLARGAVEAGLAACVQVDGPVISHYRWEGRVETASEHRLMFKFLPEQAAALEAWIRARHPYDTPEWIVARAEHVSEKYLSWARATSTPGPFPPPQPPA